MSYVVKEKSLTDIANAIREKGNTTEQLSFPDGFINAVNEIKTGGTGDGVVEKDVNFFDYDGTLLFSYTEAEALALTELPTPEPHNGLTFQGWNFTLEEMKLNADAADIGAFYVTDDGSTRLYLSIDKYNTGIEFDVFGDAKMTTLNVDWGDGTTEVINGSYYFYNISHTYSGVGEYVISIKQNEGATFTLGQGNRPFIHRIMTEKETTYTTLNVGAGANCLKKIECGDGIKGFNQNSLKRCVNLETISISKNINSYAAYSFYYCPSLKFIIYNSTKSNIKNVFYSCGIKNISINLNLQYGIDFNECYDLKRIIYPKSQNDGNYINSSFYIGSVIGCASLETYINKKSGMKNGNLSLADCHSLNRFELDYTDKLNTQNFSPANKIYNFNISDNVVTINGQGLRNLAVSEFEIGRNVKTIALGVFADCTFLRKAKFLGDVTSLDSAVFTNCYSLEEIDFTNCTTVPTLSTSSSIPDNDFLVIKVPASLEAEWKASTNWASFADRIIGV